jgi:hypothetical protein
MAGAWFVEVMGDGLTFRLLPGAPLLLGRGGGCGIILQSDQVGDRQASLVLREDRVLLRPEADWRSTTVNGVAVGRRDLELHLDDVVQAGEYQLRLVRASDVQAACLAHEGRQVVHLARVIARDKRYDELPILGDALEEAGCADAALLAHFRQRRPHLRGCCFLEQILAAGELSHRP